MKKLYILVGIMIFGGVLVAQDFHFSQYQWSPLYLNPALTGNMSKGAHRVILKHRNQWSSVLNDGNTNFLGNQAFQTFMASYDGRQCGKDFLAFGVNAVADIVGQPAFRTYQGHASMAYHLSLEDDAYLSGGFQIGAIHHRFDNTRLSFDTQFDPQNGYNPVTPSQEQFNDRPNITFFDLGGGFTFYRLSQRANRYKLGYTLGASVTHLGARRDYSFLAVNNQDPNIISDRGERLLRWAAHATLILYKNKGNNKQDVTIRQLFMLQGPHWQYVPMVEYGMGFKGNNSFFQDVSFGLGTRITRSVMPQSPVVDAILLNLQSDITETMAINLAYDVNISPLRRASNGLGAFEISLLLSFQRDTKCTECPGL